jgi:hypothetical protein
MSGVFGLFGAFLDIPGGTMTFWITDHWQPVGRFIPDQYHRYGSVVRISGEGSVGFVFPISAITRDVGDHGYHGSCVAQNPAPLCLSLCLSDHRITRFTDHPMLYPPHPLFHPIPPHSHPMSPHFTPGLTSVLPHSTPALNQLQAEYSQVWLFG